MKKIRYILLIIFLLFIVQTKPAFAKKVLPFLRSTKPVVASQSSSVTSSVKFRGDRLGIIVTLNNLQAASKVDYFLSYQTKGTMQGASGSITDTSVGSATRDIIFGSCSKGACRYDTGITNAKFVITIYLANGKRIVRSYRLKV